MNFPVVVFGLSQVVLTLECTIMTNRNFSSLKYLLSDFQDVLSDRGAPVISRKNLKNTHV